MSHTGRGESLAAFAQRLRQFLHEHKVQKLVVDLRHNNGGNTYLYNELFRTIVEFDASDENRRLFVLIGRGTYSAAVNFVVDLERFTRAVFVGEPTGGKPNTHGDESPTVLPYSGTYFLLSCVYWQLSSPRDSRLWIPASIPVALLAQDYFANRDPVLESALKLERPADLKSSQGIWYLTSITDDGWKVPEAAVQKMTITIAGNEYKIRLEDKVLERGTFVLDPSQNPKTIDATIIEGQDKGKTTLGIYMVDEKTRQVCFAPPGQPRPTAFESKPGSKWALFIADRQSGDEATSRDLQQLQGEWRMVSMERGGKKVDDRLVKTFRRTVTGRKHIVTWEEDGVAQKLSTTLTLDPAQNPKSVDVLITDGPLKGKKRLGVYKFEGDTETVCLALLGQPRPTGFDSKQGTLHVWRKAKNDAATHPGRPQ